MKKHFYFSSSTEFFIPFYVSLLFYETIEGNMYDNMAQYMEDFMYKKMYI